MHRPHPGRVLQPLLIFMAAACLCAILAPLVYAQVCSPFTLHGWMPKPRDPQGLIHVAVKYDGGSIQPTPEIRALMEEAVAE